MADISTDQTKLTPSAMVHAIRHMRQTGVSLYVHGAPGISKSAVSRQVADSLGIAFIDFRLTSVAPEDVRGVPFLDDVGGIKGLIWTPPLVFPRDLDFVGTVDTTGTEVVKFYNPLGNNKIYYCKKPEITVRCLDDERIVEIVEEGPDRFVVAVRNSEGRIVPGRVLWHVTGKSEAIFGLEEFNSAPPSVMAAAYQLILDRRIGDYIVPDGVMLVAMGNRRGDKGLTFEIPKPVANRFIHLQMIHNFDDWQGWAIQNNVHSDVIGYLSKWESHLFDDKFAEKPDQSFATPRSWEFVSKVISQTPSPPQSVMRALICGAVGNVIGTQFVSHREYMAAMPNVKSIFDGTTKTFNIPPQNSQYKTQIAYSTCVQMCYQLKQESDEIDRKYKGFKPEIDKSQERKEWIVKADRAIGYAIDNFSPEVLIVLNRMAMQIYKLRFSSSNMTRFEEFCDLHRNTILT